MTRTTLKDLSLLLLLLGCLSLFGSVIAYYGGFTLVGLTGFGTYYPFRWLTGILMVAGSVLLIIGSGLRWRLNQEKEEI